MKICVAQTRPVTGEIESNVVNHKKLITRAILSGAEIIIFPELSLTGYEPRLAADLATDQNDKRLDDFQEISDAAKITIGVGMPLKNDAGISIGLVIFQPGKARQSYVKKYLHADEELFFVAGQQASGLFDNRIALAICYEISVPAHVENAVEHGARIYIASVAKFTNGVAKAKKTLGDIALKYGMLTFMANSIGKSDGNECGGNSAVWNSKGELMAMLDDNDEGILIADSESNETFVEIM
jgi:predicted amidohydrolase